METAFLLSRKEGGGSQVILPQGLGTECQFLHSLILILVSSSAPLPKDRIKWLWFALTLYRKSLNQASRGHGGKYTKTCRSNFPAVTWLDNGHCGALMCRFHTADEANDLWIKRGSTHPCGVVCSARKEMAHPDASFLTCVRSAPDLVPWNQTSFIGLISDYLDIAPRGLARRQADR